MVSWPGREGSERGGGKEGPWPLLEDKKAVRGQERVHRKKFRRKKGGENASRKKKNEPFSPFHTRKGKPLSTTEGRV